MPVNLPVNLQDIMYFLLIFGSDQYIVCPGCKISGGVSNIAFSFRGNEPVRRAFHSAFLHHACKVCSQHCTSTFNACCACCSCRRLECMPVPSCFSKGQQRCAHCHQAGMDMGIVNAAHCVADVYEQIDKELLQHVEDVLLNRSDDATEKMLDYAATLVPTCRLQQACRRLLAAPASAGCCTCT
jgi:5-methyltetrahydrofolate--homocysteine methyltransferase